RNCSGPTYSDSASLGPEFAFPTAAPRVGKYRSGAMEVKVIDVLLPNTTFDHPYEPGRICQGWMPLPVTVNPYSDAEPEYADPNEIRKTTEKMGPLTMAASDALFSLLPVAGLAKIADRPQGPEFWFFAIHRIMGTKADRRLANGTPIRVIDDISLSSE